LPDVGDSGILGHAVAGEDAATHPGEDLAHQGSAVDAHLGYALPRYVTTDHSRAIGWIGVSRRKWDAQGRSSFAQFLNTHQLLGSTDGPSRGKTAPRRNFADRPAGGSAEPRHAPGAYVHGGPTAGSCL